MLTTTRTPGSTEGALRFVLGHGPRPADVCPTLGHAIATWVRPRLPLLPPGLNADALGALLSDTDEGEGISALRAWAIAEHLAQEVVPRWLRARDYGDGLPLVPEMRSGADVPLVLELFTRATCRIVPPYPGDIPSLRASLHDSGNSALLAGACAQPLHEPLAAAVAGASGALILRCAGSMPSAKTHSLGRDETPRTIALLRSLRECEAE